MHHEPIIVRAHRPNAWISEIERLGALLDAVYAHTSGEIWLFDNDLKVLEDHRDAFRLLYRDRIDGSLSTRVRCVKLLLSSDLYSRFADKTASPQLFENLCSLRADRLRTFFVGCLEETTPRPQPTRGGRHPWIFYLGEDQLRSRDGIVIVRPNTYPFAQDDNHDDLAIAWKASDTEVQAVHIRLSSAWFQKAFVTNCEANFRSIEPACDADGKVVGYELVAPRDDRAITTILASLSDRHSRPVEPPVDCAVITTLDEEFQAAVNALSLTEGTRTGYATGWHSAPRGPVSVVAAQALDFGSVCSAEATVRLIHEWAPKTVFLIGRCGGWREDVDCAETGEPRRDEDDLQEGDVIVGNKVCAYEYQKIERRQGKTEIEYDQRSIDTSPRLRQVAQGVIRKHNWAYEGDLPADWGNRRKPKAIVGAFASGNKLVRLGETWFEEIKKALGSRKIIGIEMEGEGVGWAARVCEPSPDFLIVKAVSDFADPEKSDKYKTLSSATSAQFLADLLSSEGFRGIIDGR